MRQPTIEGLTHPCFILVEVLPMLAHMPRRVAQTWIERGHIELEQPNPGTGRPRLFSPLDVAKLALLDRFSAFGVSFDLAKRHVDEAAARVRREGLLPWGDMLKITYRALRGLEETEGGGAEPVLTMPVGEIMNRAMLAAHARSPYRNEGGKDTVTDDQKMSDICAQETEAAAAALQARIDAIEKMSEAGPDRARALAAAFIMVGAHLMEVLEGHHTAVRDLRDAANRMEAEQAESATVH